MGHAADGSQRVIDDLMAAFSMQVGDRTHAAVVVFLGELMEGIRHQRGAWMVKWIHGKSIRGTRFE